MEQTLQTLAAEARAGFVQGARVDSLDEPIWVRTDVCTEWVTDLVFAAHDGSLPDDWTYRFLVEALDVIAEMDDPEDCDEAHEVIDGCVDMFNHRLRAWFSAGREDRVDEAVETYGHHPTGIMGDLMAGQYMEIQDVYTIVLSHLCEELVRRES